MALLPRRKQQREPAQELHAVTAAAARLNLADPRKAVKQAGRRQEWQQDAWTFFDECPEVKFTTWWAGNALSQVRLFGAVEPTEEDEQPIDVADPKSGISPATVAAVKDELRRLRSQYGGQGEILRELSMNVDIAGEGWIIGFGARPEVRDATGAVTSPATVEEWDVKSCDEVVSDPRGTRVREFPGDPGRPLVDGLDCAIRIWQRHPRWSQLADSGMRGILGDCEALLTFQAEQMAQSRSRHNSGLLLLPNGLSTGPKPGPEVTEQGEQTDPFEEAIVEGYVTPVDDPTAEGAVAPTLIRGDRDDLKEVRWVDTGRKPAGDLDDRIEKRVQRVARGLNAPVEVVMGHQSTTFANAEQIDEDEFEDFHRPRLLLICDGLTVGYLRPNLLARGCPPEEVERVIVWFDPSALLAEPDMAPVAQEAHAAGTISDAAYRSYRGFDESDAPTADERLARAGLDRGKLSDALSLALLKLLDPSLVVEAMPVPVAEPATPEAAATPDAIAAGARVVLTEVLTARISDPASRDRAAASLARVPLSSLLSMAAQAHRPAIETTALVAAAPRAPRARTQAGRQLMDIDRELRTRLLTLADVELGQILDRAGNRIRAKAGVLRDLTASIAARDRAAHVGRNVLSAQGVTDDELLAGAFDSMEASFMEWGAQAQRQALEVVGRVVGGFSVAERETLGLRQAADLGEAWQWLHSTLTSLAHARLYDPAPAVPAAGEVASTLVAPGVIREAIARAGGAAGLTNTPSGGAYVTLADAGSRPVGGIGTGDLLRDQLRDGGAEVPGYVWEYGPGGRTRPFEPHEELDGVEFAHFDDDVLANSDSFPESSYYLPGDHDGCLCDFSPIIMTAADSADLSADDADPDE